MQTAFSADHPLLKQPLKYGFEALMVNEFHGLHGICSSLIPQGPGYENIGLDNQACTTVGSVPGQATVSGDEYVELSFNYSYSHLWRVCIEQSYYSSAKFVLIELRDRVCVWSRVRYHLPYLHGIQYRVCG